MVDYTDLVILSNTIIMAATLIATLYRIKIEHKQIHITEENLKYKKRVEIFRIMLEKEKDEIMKMQPQEIYDMLEKVWKDEDRS